MKLALAQINPTVGDIAGNAELIITAIKEAEANGADLVVFPELCLTGYPPEDLLLKPAFIKDNMNALKSIAPFTQSTAAVVGFVDGQKNKIFNAAAWIQKGKVQTIYRKQCLPNYGVFDEARYFSPGNKNEIKKVFGHRIGLSICEDIWVEGAHWAKIKKMKPDLLLNLSASPFHSGKVKERQKIGAGVAKKLKTTLAYCNMTGAQDELVFDGGSFICSMKGQVKATFPLFSSGIYYATLDKKNVHPLSKKVNAPDKIEEIFHALVTGIKNYVTKNNFQKVALGLSGGIDSALVATLAVEALGPKRVVGITMPTKFNKNETKNDAAKLAKNLGIKFLSIPIQASYEKLLGALAPSFENMKPGLAEENLQARIRGNILMTLSNKFSWLILTTGNKSETSTGYSTLYGDTAGGFAVLKDVLKTTAYDLARFINKTKRQEIIPQTTITRPPTAELRDNQCDEDSLGSYSDLDPLIVGYVEENKSIKDLIKKYPKKEAYVRRIISLIDRNEYKRRQAPPGVKITPRAFGRDHRMPITNKYTSS